VGAVAEGAAVRPLPALAALALVITPARALGGPPTELEPGAPAPYSGTLLERPYLADLLKAEAQRDRARAETRGVRARLIRTEADLSAERAQREADRAEAESRERAWADAMARAEATAREAVRPSWSGWPWVAAGLGAVAGGLFFYAVR
jgi:hypothetical protein